MVWGVCIFRITMVYIYVIVWLYHAYFYALYALCKCETDVNINKDCGKNKMKEEINSYKV